MKKSVVGIFLACILVSCLEELDKLDRIEDSAFEPIIDFPLINSQFTMEDLLTEGNSQANINQQTGGLLVLTYDDTIATPPGDLFFLIPSQSGPDLVINGSEVVFPGPGGSVTINRSMSFPLDTSNGEVLDSIWLKGGDIVLNVTSTLAANVTLTVTVPSLKVPKTSFSQILNLNGPSTQNSSSSLANGKIDLTDNGTNTNTITFNVKAVITSTGQAVNVSQSLTCSFDLNDLGFSGLFGDLGTRSTTFDEKGLNVDVFDNAFKGTVQLLSPSLRLDMINSFGLPIGFGIRNITGTRDGLPTVVLSGPVVSAPLNPYLIAAPSYAQVGQAMTTSINIAPNNSNLPALISSLPKFISYGFDVSLNPAGANKNFVLSTSKLEVGLHMELPFHGQVNQVVLQKRYDFSGLGIDDVNNSKIKLKTTNESPLDVSIQIYFVDTSGDVLDSLFKNPSILKGAPVGADGFTNGSADVTLESTITQAQIDRIENAEFIDMKATVYTTNKGTVPVKFSIADRFTINLGLSTKMKYDF